MSRLARWWQRTTAPRLSRAAVADALARSLASPRLVMMHSSLSHCGTVEGGADTVVDAAIEWVGAGTLAMPTHTYCYPNAAGQAPLFDVATTPSLTGAITETFRRRDGVRRSVHPTHALSVRGPMAGELTSGHEQCHTPCGAGTPYAWLVDHDAAVVMFGVTLNTYTLFHTAEDAADVPYLYERVPSRLRYRAIDGAERELLMQRQDMHVLRRFAERAAWLEARGLLRRTRLGRGELLVLPSAAQVHAAIVAELARDPWFLAYRAA